MGLLFCACVGKKLRACQFLHCLLTFLGFLSKTNINQVKWILYKEKSGVDLEDQLFLNQISITLLRFLSLILRDCTNFE